MSQEIVEKPFLIGLETVQNMFCSSNWLDFEVNCLASPTNCMISQLFARFRDVLDDFATCRMISECVGLISQRLGVNSYRFGLIPQRLKLFQLVCSGSNNCETN